VGKVSERKRNGEDFVLEAPKEEMMQKNKISLIKLRLESAGEAKLKGKNKLLDFSFFFPF